MIERKRHAAEEIIGRLRDPGVLDLQRSEDDGGVAPRPAWLAGGERHAPTAVDSFASRSMSSIFPNM